MNIQARLPRLSACAACLAGVLLTGSLLASIATPTVGQAQRLGGRRTSSEARLESTHFDIVYDPRVLGAEQAEEARALAEKGWERCTMLFGAAPGYRLRLDLTPDFAGATGFARPGDPKSKDERRRPLIGVRYADLEYLGLTGEYVLTHEIAHIFSDQMAGTSLGEGVADWAAGGFSGVPLRPWWGTALQAAGLWIDPDAFFITGEFETSGEVDATIRTAQYSESALLLQFLVDRFGWEKTRKWAEEYGKAREALISNEDRRRLRLPPGFRLEPNKSDPRRPPNADAVRATFERHFGQSWAKLSTDWLASMQRDPPPAGLGERLVLGQKLYGAVRNYEMWVLAQKQPPNADIRALVRSAFTEANRKLAAGQTEAARQSFRRAAALVEQLRRPSLIAGAAPDSRQVPATSGV